MDQEEPGCPVCLEHYDLEAHDPMIGTCGHSICTSCRSCLGNFTCPICKKSDAFKEQTPNYSLRDHVQILKDLQKAAENPNAINLLVMGETGVGKSTWINAIANYISYGDIDEASSRPLINLIPTEFTISVKNNAEMKKIKVKIGESINEQVGRCCSATQHPKAYVFIHEGTTYRIIDTPGMGDTRGVQQDKENIQNTLNFISKYEHIHAVCILLLPNQSRLTDTFEFCFKEIVMQFHKTAAKNIVFCFTNTSGSGFTVGQTHEPLTELVDEIEEKQGIVIPLNVPTMYSFDNMAYRYLCAKSAEPTVDFGEMLENLYRQSFTVSREETVRLLNHVKSIVPHNTSDTVTLNYVRSVIQRLSGPLAVINILESIREKEQDIAKNKHDSKELGKVLMRRIPISHWEVQSTLQRYCKKCAVLKEYRGRDRDQYIEAMPRLMNQDPVIIEECTFLGDAQVCGKCSGTNIVSTTEWLAHVTEMKDEEDSNVRSRINDKEGLLAEVVRQLAELKTLKDEYIIEQTQIRKAAAKFSYFLKKNSITTYNDATEKYLKHLIEAAEEKGKRDDAKKLQTYLEQYQAERATVEADFAVTEEQGSSPIGPKEVMELAQALQNMKHHGRDVHQALQFAHGDTNSNGPNDDLFYSKETGVVNGLWAALRMMRRLVL